MTVIIITFTQALRGQSGQCRAAVELGETNEGSDQNLPRQSAESGHFLV